MELVEVYNANPERVGVDEKFISEMSRVVEVPRNSVTASAP